MQKVTDPYANPGGLGGLGLVTAHLLADMGATCIILLSRSGLIQRTDQDLNDYLNQLKTVGNLEFACEGRACGSSSYWANKIFNNAVLYGPEQFQNYAVFRTPSGWWTIYISQRATRKIYARLDHYFLGEKAD